MRVRTLLMGLAVAVAIAACGGSADVDPVDPVVGESVTPLSILDRARDVADQLENRQADLEAQLNDPFSQP